MTLIVNSTDLDGDAITYEYDGKADNNYYSVGSHTVRLRAKDHYGGVSAWAQTTFTVTITSYTFTVPPVSGHSGQDYGRVRGYNVKAGAWDQLDYGTTNNGITFTRSLTPRRLLQAGHVLLHQSQLYVQQIQHHLYGGILL